MFKIGEVNACGARLQVMHVKYASGANGIQLFDPQSGPFATLSTNGPGVSLAADEVAVKTWDGNEELRQPMLESGLFSDTGNVVVCGNNLAEVWKINSAIPA
jgi:hypothetical protein